ncbi:hypothetical protein BKA69DRAFT_912622 [Paraphysoderma sedebokerense]|nr:hypothetical protein BKA69DRAFT_912622 [Paraphysoderma sedebokerense]
MSCLSKDDDAAILSLTISLAASMDEKNLARPQPLGEDKPQMNLRIHPSSSTRSASQSRPYSCFARASHSLKSLFCSCLRPSPHTTSPQFNDEPDCSPYDSNTQVVNSVTVNSSIDNTVPVKSVNDSSQFATSTSLNNNTARNTLDKTSPLPGQTNLKSSDSSTSSAASDNHSAQNLTQPSSQSNMTNSTNIAEAKQDLAKGNWNPITSVNPDSLITQVQPSSTGKHLSVPPRRAKVGAGANDNNVCEK